MMQRCSASEGISGSSKRVRETQLIKGTTARSESYLVMDAINGEMGSSSNLYQLEIFWGDNFRALSGGFRLLTDVSDVETFSDKK